MPFILLFTFLNSHSSEDLVRNVWFLPIIFVAVIVHELGHAFMATSFKLPIRHIMVTFFGGYVQFRTQPKNKLQDILISSAGPAANLALSGAFILLQRAMPEDFFYTTMSEVLADAIWINFVLGLFNLAPGLPLDGGHILRSFLSLFIRFERAHVVAAWGGVIVGTLVIAWGATSGPSLWNMMIGALIAWSAWNERGRYAL